MTIGYCDIVVNVIVFVCLKFVTISDWLNSRVFNAVGKGELGRRAPQVKGFRLVASLI